MAQRSTKARSARRLKTNYPQPMLAKIEIRYDLQKQKTDETYNKPILSFERQIAKLYVRRILR